jgi:PAS domain S-box-containing protein
MTERDLPAALWRPLALVVLPCLALIGMQTYQVLGRSPELRRSNALVVHTFEVITTAEALERVMQDAVRGERGYLITGDEAYLVSYRSGVQEAPALLSRLKQLTADNPHEQERIPVLARHIDAALQDMRQALDAYRENGFAAAQAVVRSNAGMDAMRALSSIIDETTTNENTLLSQRLARVEESQSNTVYNALAGIAIAAAIMAVGIALSVIAVRNTRRMATARSASEERFRLLVDGVADHALYLMDVNGHVTDWNAGAERLKGYSASEAVGQHFSVFYSEEDRQAGVPQQVLENATRRGKVEVEGVRVRKDGSRFWASAVVTALRDAEGRLLGFAKITRDITERMQHQEALEQARAALAQAQKMEALGQLTGGMAHDFNNFLHVIKNALEIVGARVQSTNPDYVRYLDMAKRNTDRATAVTQRLLAFARRQPLDPKPSNPNKLVQNMTDLLRHALGEGIAMETVLSSGIWTVLADPNQLETAILNLAVNARDAMRRSGKLTIETANAFLDEPYAAAHPEVTPGQYVMIAVSDTGVGMTREVLAQAFEPFFTTKQPGEGTGLGLSQVFGFVKQSGGHIKIYSEPGEGTTVKIYLPRHQASGAVVTVNAVAAHNSPTGEKVLVVEDEDDVRAFTTEMLTELGYHVSAAADAHSALKLLESSSGVDLLFTDVGLPNGVNGRQLADEVRRRWPTIRVLFTTAYARNAIVHHGRLDPGVDLIVKPFTQSDLARKVRQVLSVARS